MASSKCGNQVNQSEEVAKHFDETKPEVSGILNKTIIVVNSKLENVADFVGDTYKKVANKINPKEGYNPKIETDNEVTKTLEKVINTKQKTNNEIKHRKLLLGFIDTIKSQFQPFKSTNNYVVQTALITQRESNAIALTSAQRQLTNLYNKDGKSTSSDLQDMLLITMSGSMIDNYKEGYKMPMKKSVFNKIIAEQGQEYLDLQIEKAKNSKTAIEYIKKNENTLETLNKKNEENNDVIKENKKEIDKLSKQIKELNKELKKTKNETEIKNINNKKDSLKNQSDQFKKLNKDKIDYRDRLKASKLEIKKLNSEENLQRLYENEVYAKSVSEIRTKYFGKNYVEREMNGETLTLKDIDNDSELANNPKLYELYSGRIKMFNDARTTLINRAGEVLGTKKARELSQQLGHYQYYYKNVVNDVELATSNYKDKVAIGKGLKYRNVGEYIRRMGTEKDIDNNILYIDTIAIGQMIQQTLQLDFIETIKEFDLNKKAIKSYQNKIKDAMNLFVDRITNNKTIKSDKNIIRKIKYISNGVASLISNNPNIDQSLLDVIGDIKNDNFNKIINGENMNVFERLDYVFNESITYLEEQFKNNIDVNVLTNFYHTFPQFKDTIDYFIGNTDTRPTQEQLMYFLEDYGNSNFDGSHNAHNLFKIQVQKSKYKNAIEQEMNINFRETLEEGLEGNLMTDYVITTMNGNPLNYNLGNKKINRINLKMMLDVQYADIASQGKEAFQQFMVSMDDEYLEEMFRNQDVMVFPKDIGEGLIESLTPPNDIGKYARIFNKWLRPLMILSPERILKFNFNTALMSDIYRVTQTNPKILVNVKESIMLIKELYDKGFVTNKFDAKDSVYDNKEKIMWEFQKIYGGQFENEMQVVGQRVSSNKWDKLMSKIETIDNNEKFSLKKKTYRMLKTYLDFVGPKTTAREMTLRLSYALETAKEIDGGKDIHYGASKKSQVDEFLKRDNNFKFVASVANQNFIAYKEAGRFARRVNRAYMPFFLFPEGNMKWHYRLYENYINEIVDSSVSYERRMKALGKVGISMSIQLGLAQAIWNLLQRGMFGAPDDEEIPTYLKGKAMPFDDLFEKAGIPTENYLQFGPVVMNKFNLAQDVMTFIPDFGEGKSGSEIALDYGKTWLGRVTPLLKTPVELAMGGDFYSDGNMYPVNPKYTLGDNVARKIAGLFGFTKTFQYGYDMVKGMPNAYQNTDNNMFGDIYGYSKMMVQYQGNAVLTSERNTHSQVKSMFYSYLDEIGRPYDPTPKYSNEKDKLKNAIKVGLKYNDLEYVDMMVAEYMDYLIANGKTINETKSQIQSLIRGQSLLYTGNISALDRQKFVQSLSVSEYEQYKKALDYERIMFGKYYALLLK